MIHGTSAAALHAQFEPTLVVNEPPEAGADCVPLATVSAHVMPPCTTATSFDPPGNVTVILSLREDPVGSTVNAIVPVAVPDPAVMWIQFAVVDAFHAPQDEPVTVTGIDPVPPVVAKDEGVASPTTYVHVGGGGVVTPCCVIASDPEPPPHDTPTWPSRSPAPAFCATVYVSVAESLFDDDGDTVIHGTSGVAVHEQPLPAVFVTVIAALVPPAGAVAESEESA